MAVQADGDDLAINADIVNEFGGDAPHAISEYYGGGDIVGAAANPNVPTSGEVQLSDFYSAVNATSLGISSNINNYDIAAKVQAAGGDLNTPVVLTINTGVTVGSTSTGTPAMYTNTGWGTSTQITITNNGSIVGAAGQDTSANPSTGGGNGGVGSGGTNAFGQQVSAGTGPAQNGLAGTAGANGSGSAQSANNGGAAFTHTQTANNNLSVVFATNGTRTGGAAGTLTGAGSGGGGGGGGGNGAGNCDGGGGGGGAGGGSGGVGGQAGVNGQNGSSTAAGNGGGSGNSGCGMGHGGNGCGNCVNTGQGSAQGNTAQFAGAGSGGNGGGFGIAGQSGGSGAQSHFYGHGYMPGSTGGGGGGAGSSATADGTAGAALAGNTGKITSA